MKERTKAQRRMCSWWYLFKLRTLNKITKRKKQNRNSKVTKHTKQKITTHKTQSKTGYLNMVLNQGQQLTATSDWEPYQAKHRKPNHRKTNIDNPPNSRPDHTKNKDKTKELKSEPDNLDQQTVLCKLCQRIVLAKGGNPSNLFTTWKPCMCANKKNLPEWVQQTPGAAEQVPRQLSLSYHSKHHSLVVLPMTRRPRSAMSKFISHSERHGTNSNCGERWFQKVDSNSRPKILDPKP